MGASVGIDRGFCVCGVDAIDGMNNEAIVHIRWVNPA